jgi:hypothetical protein
VSCPVEKERREGLGIVGERKGE